MLGLSPAVTPNKATHIVAVVVPAGTVIARGLAAPQNPREKYPGGGSRFSYRTRSTRGYDGLIHIP